MKAKYIGKYYGKGYDRNNVYLKYEYRGEEYTIVENRAKGNEPLSWQHRVAQDRIDTILDTPHKETKPIDWDEIWTLLGFND